MKNTTVTTTGLAVGDNEASRTPIQRDADPNAAAEGQPLRDDLGRFASRPASKYAGKMPIDTGLAAAQPSELRPVRVQQVDHRALEGSNAPNDFRSNPGDTAKAPLNKAADNGGPRNDVGQFKGSRYETQPATQKYPTPEVGD